VRTLIPLIDAGSLPRLRLLWLEEAGGELHVKEMLLDLGSAMHVETIATTTRRWRIRGWRDPPFAQKPRLVWGKDGDLVRLPCTFCAATTHIIVQLASLAGMRPNRYIS
jgi:hypothetical protein